MLEFTAFIFCLLEFALIIPEAGRVRNNALPGIVLVRLLGHVPRSVGGKNIPLSEPDYV